MLEVFHFITPLQFESFQAQKALTQVLKSLNTKYSYHVLPLISLATMDEAYRQGIETNTHISFQVDYAISLDYVAMLSQGRNLARKFLYALQEQLLVRQNTYSDLIIKQVITDIGGDLELFVEERNSKQTTAALIKNQQFANEYQIVKNPAALIFDSNNPDHGIILENFVTTELETILNQYLNNQRTLIEPYMVLHR